MNGLRAQDFRRWIGMKRVIMERIMKPLEDVACV
jgi:hypothetical protein